MNLPIPWMGKDPLYKGDIPAVPGWYTKGNCRFEGFKDLGNLVIIVATEYASTCCVLRRYHFLQWHDVMVVK